MVDFSTLDPETRCIALVGEFLRRWSKMEARLNEAIRRALGLDEIMGQILTANMQARDKIHLLRTIVSLSTIPEPDKKIYTKTLADISDYSVNRNMMAHDQFGPDDTQQGVNFFQVKAKGNYSLPKVDWMIPTFEEAYIRIDIFHEQLDNLMQALSVIHFDLSQLARQTLHQAYDTTYMPRTMSAVLMDYLSRQPPVDPDLSQPNPAKEN